MWDREGEREREVRISIHGIAYHRKQHTIQERVMEVIVAFTTVIFIGIGIVLLSREDDKERIEKITAYVHAKVIVTCLYVDLEYIFYYYLLSCIFSKNIFGALYPSQTS